MNLSHTLKIKIFTGCKLEALLNKGTKKNAMTKRLTS